MKRIAFAIASGALALTLAGSLAAQDNQGGQDRNQFRGQGGGGQGFRNMDWQNMDPQQIQEMIRQRMMEGYREQLEVENDAEWQVIEERLNKVLQARQELSADGGGGLMGLVGAFGRGGRGGGGGGFGGGAGRGLQAYLGQQSAEAQALQQAVDNKAPTTELKEKLAKLQEVRKTKQANLTKAQDELRKVLSVRRESIAVLIGILE
jgi:hypothetical protein